MFQQLKPLVAKSPIAMNVVAEGDLLRVTIAQKTSRRGTPLNISVLASAEDLDRDLPGEIDKAANQTHTPAPIAEQVRAQVTAAPAAKPKKAAPAAKPAKKAKLAKAPKTSRPKPLKQAKAPKIAPKHKIRLPGTGKKKAAPHASRPAPHAPSSDGVKHHASKPGKEQCIADYHAMKAKHGDKVNRQFFIDNSKTGRRFERLWGMSWEKFVAAAEGFKRAGGKPTVSEYNQRYATKVKADAPAPAAPRSAKPAAPAKPNPQLTMLPENWPFPTTPKDVELGKNKDDTSDGHDVYDEKGNYLSSIVGQPELGETLQLAGRPHVLKVFAIDGCRVMVKAATPPAVPEKRTTEAPTASVASAPAEVADPVNETVDTSKPHPPRVIKEKGGKLIAGGFTAHVKAGELLEIGGGKWTVSDFNERHIIVEPRDAGATS